MFRDQQTHSSLDVDPREVGNLQVSSHPFVQTSVAVGFEVVVLEVDSCWFTTRRARPRHQTKFLLQESAECSPKGRTSCITHAHTGDPSSQVIFSLSDVGDTRAGIPVEPGKPLGRVDQVEPWTTGRDPALPNGMRVAFTTKRLLRDRQLCPFRHARTGSQSLANASTYGHGIRPSSPSHGASQSAIARRRGSWSTLWNHLPVRGRFVGPEYPGCMCWFDETRFGARP